MTGEERRAYYRGYNAGSANRWPAHKPPLPPDEVLGPAIEAARNLRDVVDMVLATLVEDDTFVVELGPMVDAFDAAMVRWTEWLRATEERGCDPGRT